MDNQIKKFKILSFSKLSAKKIEEVRRFIAQCKRADRHEPLFYWESIRNRKNVGVNELLCFSDEGSIVGYLAMYHFEDHEVEITLMVHPDFRQRVLYSNFFEQAKKAISHYSVKVESYVFSCNQKYHSLKEYLSYLGGKASEYTYKLSLTPKRFEKLNFKRVEELEFRKASIEDLERLVEIERACFPISADPYKIHLLHMLENDATEIYVLTKSGKIVGKIHVLNEKNTSILYDFCIAPDEQRQGCGRTLLIDTLQHLFKRGIKKVFVDVVDELDMNFYKKFNFKCCETYEHWKVAAYANPVKEREKYLEKMLLNFHSKIVQDQLSPSNYKH